jgi:hypothetical protein
VGAVGALLQLRVDVERHLRVGMAGLAHDPLDVEAVGEHRLSDLKSGRSLNHHRLDNSLTRPYAAKQLVDRLAPNAAGQPGLATPAGAYRPHIENRIRAGNTALA